MSYQVRMAQRVSRVGTALQVKQVVPKFFHDCRASSYPIEIERLIDRYEKRFNSEGDYIEK